MTEPRNRATPALTTALVTLLTGLATIGVVSWMDDRWWGDPTYAYLMGLDEPASTDMVAMMTTAAVLGMVTTIVLAAAATQRLRKVPPTTAVAGLLAAWVVLIGATALLTPTPTPAEPRCLEGVTDPSQPLPTVPCH